MNLLHRHSIVHSNVMPVRYSIGEDREVRNEPNPNIGQLLRLRPLGRETRRQAHGIYETHSRKNAETMAPSHSVGSVLASSTGLSTVRGVQGIKKEEQSIAANKGNTGTCDFGAFGWVVFGLIY